MLSAIQLFIKNIRAQLFLMVLDKKVEDLCVFFLGGFDEI